LALFIWKFLLVYAKGCGVVVDVKGNIRMEGVLYLRQVFPVWLRPAIVAGVEGDIGSLTLLSVRSDTRQLQLLFAFFIFHQLILLILMVFDEFACISESLIIIRFSYLIKLGSISGPLLMGFMLVWGTH
jgi:hypothetical protein